MMQIINTIVPWDIEYLNFDTSVEVFVDSISYDSNLKILLKSSTQEISVIFKKNISFRVSDESYLLEYWSVLPDGMNNITFSKIESSSFVKEISRLSKNFFVDGGPEMIEHYAIFTSNECIEIISDLKPLIEIIDRVNKIS